MSSPITSATTVDFASAARSLTREARRRGLVGPSFRCPPRLVGVDRTIRRRTDGATVSVRFRGRPCVSVLAYMIYVVVVANQLAPQQYYLLRSELWALCGIDSVAVQDDSGAIARVA